MARAKLRDGDIFYVSNAAVTTEPADAAAYETIFDASTKVSNVVNVPDIGYTSSVSMHEYVDDEFASPDAGMKTGTSGDIVYGYDTAATPDAGQVILQTAANGQERRVISIERLDGSVTSAWVLVSNDTRSGGSVGTHNERVSNVTTCAVPVDYIPTP